MRKAPWRLRLVPSPRAAQALPMKQAFGPRGPKMPQHVLLISAAAMRKLMPSVTRWRRHQKPPHSVVLKLRASWNKLAKRMPPPLPR